jgi:uncharacterized membrane protein YidH (DUF202 family)
MILTANDKINSIEVISNIISKEFQHLLHVEKRADITLGIASFLLTSESIGYAVLMSNKEDILRDYPLFITVFPNYYLLPGFILAIISLIILVWAVTKAVYVKFSKKGVVSHFSIVFGALSYIDYVERLKAIIKNENKLFYDLAYFIRGLGLAAAIKKRIIHSVTCLLLLSIIWITMGTSISMYKKVAIIAYFLALLGGYLLQTGLYEFFKALKIIRNHYYRDVKNNRELNIDDIILENVSKN